jgi:replicative DNA helicase
MVEGILKEAEQKGTSPKIAIFSTELSEDDYIYRHCLMRVGLYKAQFENELHDPLSPYIQSFQRQLDNYEDQIYRGVITIYGGITKLEQIAQIMSSKSKEDMPDIIFIDYIQELSVADKYDVKDTMPIIAKKLKEYALSWKTGIVAVSQINNYALQEGNDPNKQQLAPFTFGRELVNASHCALLITRKKENGELNNELVIFVLKARNGNLKVGKYEIKNGYNLSYLPPQNGNA